MDKNEILETYKNALINSKIVPKKVSVLTDMDNFGRLQDRNDYEILFRRRSNLKHILSYNKKKYLLHMITKATFRKKNDDGYRNMFIYTEIRQEVL